MGPWYGPGILMPGPTLPPILLAELCQVLAIPFPPRRRGRWGPGQQHCMAHALCAFAIAGLLPGSAASKETGGGGVAGHDADAQHRGQFGKTTSAARIPCTGCSHIHPETATPLCSQLHREKEKKAEQRTGSRYQGCVLCRSITTGFPATRAPNRRPTHAITLPSKFIGPPKSLVSRRGSLSLSSLDTSQN